MIPDLSVTKTQGCLPCNTLPASALALLLHVSGVMSNAGAEWTSLESIDCESLLDGQDSQTAEAWQYLRARGTVVVVDNFIVLASLRCLRL
jgi:hypothetical protein